MKKTFLFFIFFLAQTLIHILLVNYHLLQTKDVDDDTPGVRGINFKPDGKIMYITSRLGMSVALQ